MATAVSLKYVVSGLTDATNDNVTVSLTPEVKKETNEDGTEVIVQSYNNPLSVILNTEEAKAFWPGQSVTLSLK